LKEGEIYFIQFEPSVGFEIQKSRPGFVVQKAPLRNTVIVLPISSKPRTDDRYEHFLKQTMENQLYKDSMVILDQVKSVSAQYFMVIMGVQRLYALQICAIHKGIALLTIIY